MKILKFLPYLPYPLSSGGRTRSYNLIKHLSKEHQVELVCFVKPGEEQSVSVLSSICHKIYTIPRLGSPTPRHILTLSLSVEPILVRFYSSSRARNLLKNVLASEQYDVLHVETYYILKNVPHDLKVPVVLAESNIEYLLTKQMARRMSSPLWKLVLYLDTLKQRFQEIQAWRYADRCVAVSVEDAEVISKYTNRPVCIVENGVDPTVKPVEYSEVSNAHGILFVGTFLHRPNVDGILFFLREIFPLILERFPTAQLMIVGDKPTPEILAFEDPPRVSVLGFVEDLQPLFEKTLVSICPIRIGSGSRLKILEALSRGHPVVTTKIGCSGLRVEHGKHLLIADTPEDFSKKLCSLLLSRKLRESIGRQGRELVLKDYNWKSKADALLSCYKSVIKEGIK